MSSEAEELRQQIAELRERVGSLEARVGELSGSRAATPPMNAVAAGSVAAAPPAVAETAAMGRADAGTRQSDEMPPEGRSLESRIGSQLFNRVGIVAVLIGVAWFLKLAIDKQWIGPASRVIVGLAAGAALIGFSERVRASGYPAFSYSLKAVATGILYLSMWSAYALFHLIPGEVAFVAMVLVTGMNALMCWMQNSEVLAFYAAIGGLITPILLSVHVRNELILFSYLLVLDTALVTLIALRPWPRLLLAAFAGTTFYAVGWYASDYSEGAFGVTLFFILAFFLLFAVSPQLLRGARLSARDASGLIEESLVLQVLPVANAVLGFLQVFILMSDAGHLALRPWIALPFAAFYLLMPGLGPAAGSTAARPPMYLVLSAAFATVAIPMEAHGRWIAIGWFLEYAILLWFAAKRGIAAFRPAAVCVLVLGAAALWLPLAFFNPPVDSVVLLNPRFGTYLVAIAACLAGTWIALRAMPVRIRDGSASEAQPWGTLAATSTLAATLLLLIAVCLEIHSYWAGSGPPATVRGSSIDEQFSYSAWLMVLGAALLTVGFLRKSALLRWQALVLLAVSIAKVFLFDTRQLSSGYRILSFLGLGALLLTVSFAYQKDWLGLRGQSGNAARL